MELETSQTIDDEWENFMTTDTYEVTLDNPEVDSQSNEIVSAKINLTPAVDIPVPGDIYISTKSKISYLNQEINLKMAFWGVNVIPYSCAKEGVIKKQMKFNSFNQEDLDEIHTNLENESYIDQHIITSINNPTGRIKFKDIRKVSIGMSKKDILSYRSKKKSAFYNCFVMIMRILENGIFKEFHIKIFNTGKIEIPGVQNDKTFARVLETIVTILQPFVETPLLYTDKSITVLINSNFNCGFYINRDVLYDILKYNYKIQCIYDPCSYPGIQSKFYYDHSRTKEEQTGIPLAGVEKQDKENITEISFMIFRTGRILIVGMCDEDVLYAVYEFIKKMLIAEFNGICQMVITPENKVVKDKTKKVRKKIINVNIV